MAGQARSSSSVRPLASKLPRVDIDEFSEFRTDVNNAVKRMTPTGGRPFVHAAILAVDFSYSDIPGVVPLRDELLDIFETSYKWRVKKYTIDSSAHYWQAGTDLITAVQSFIADNASRTPTTHTLLCVYFSGHGFQGAGKQLNICGALYPNNQPIAPWIAWSRISPVFQSVAPWDHLLMLMDCCSGGLANIDDDSIEVIGAAAWESRASASSNACFTSAIISELEVLNGMSISTTQLVSRLHCHKNVRRQISQPIHKRLKGDRSPALIHRIENTPTPPPQVTSIPRYAHVQIAVKVNKEDTIPDAKQWASWLTTNLPAYIGHIEIMAKWFTGSGVAIVVLPIQVWLDLPDKKAYVFIDYMDGWDPDLELAPTANQKENIPFRSSAAGRKGQ